MVNITLQQAKMIIDTVIQIIKECIANHESVTLLKFGVFKPKVHQSKIVTLNNNQYTTKMSLKPSFSASASVKQIMNPVDDNLLFI